MQIRSILGSNVRAAREALGWSQDKLAAETGLHRTYLSGIERGVRNPTIEIVSSLAKALRSTPSQLLSVPSRERAK